MQTGETVPDFTLPDQNGTPTSLESLLASGPVVLFFYPRAMTTGCTKESCHFRDLAGEFAEVGAQRVGISTDGVDRQSAFDEKHALGYPLLSDPGRTVARLFGVKRPGPLMNKRATFVIGTDRRILAAISSETNMDVHADEALDVLRRANAN
ncbi:MAG: peroxiredoxin [Acidobacteria bacterium]|nr:peroxiredoxin [Acidobacteriota bacterium]